MAEPAGKMTVYSPQQLNDAKAKAEAERERIRNEAHAEGQAKGFEEGQKHGERFKMVACAALGFIVGTAVMGAYFIAMSEKQQFATGLIVDRVLERTVDQGALPSPQAPQLTTRDSREAQLEAENRTGSCSTSIPVENRAPHCFRGERR